MMSKGNGCISSSAMEYTVRVPKNSTKKYNIMAFNMGDKVNCSTWTRARMERDMSARRMYGEEDSSEGAAASEFGKKQQWQESRRRKYGVVAREFKAEDQPWILRVNGKAGKKFKGQKKSGVTENTCYYIFTQQCPDGAFEAFPLNGWYNFAPLAKHRTLTVEEADEQWGRRNKVVDHFNIMLQRRLREKGCGDDEEEEDEKANNKKRGDFLDYHGSLDPTYSDSDSDGGMGEEGKSKVKKAKMGKGKASKKSKGSDNEAKEDSDDGDYEGLEVDYMSDRSSSDEEPEKGKPDKGEDVPRGIDETSESEEESEEEQNEEEGKEEEEEEEGKKTPVHGEKKDNNGVSDSSDDSDIEGWAASALFLVKKLPPPKRRGSALTASRPGTSSMDSAVTASKLEQGQLQGDTTLAKKQRMEPNCQSPAAFGKGTVPQPGKSTPSSGDTQLTEDAVRRYLIRKPMTAKDLLKKFQTKRTGLSNEQTVNFLAQILKRLNPERKNVNDKMLLYLQE